MLQGGRLKSFPSAPAPSHRQAVSELAAAIAGGRAHASALCVLALERPATQYAQLCSLASVSLTVVDGFSDAHGWGSLVGGRQGAPGPAASSSTGVAIVPLPGLLASPGSLQLLQQRLLTTLSSGGGRHCLVVDSLSPLLDAAGPAAVARLLHALQAAPSVSCLLCGVHADLHPPAALAALEQLAAGTLQLQGASDLERSLCRATGGPAGEPQGRLAVRLKRASGRVRAEAQLYCLDAAGGAVFLKPPADALNPQAAAAEKAGSAGGWAWVGAWGSGG